MLGDDDKKIQPLLSSKKSGPHLVTISQVARLRDNLGEIKLYNGNVGVVFTFINDEISHQELYWLHGYNYSKLLKLLRTIGAGTDALNRKEVIGKKLWIVIKHKIKVVDGKEVDRTADMDDFSPADKKPNCPPIFEDYNITGINTEEFPEL